LTNPLEQVFLENLALLKRIAAFTCRRRGASDDEAEEFEAWLVARMVESGYRPFEKFDQRSSLKTFLAVVVQRQFSDFRTQKWGRWRPSTQAVRLGPEAVELERMTHRDGFTADEAVRTLYERDRTQERLPRLEALAEALPPRVAASRLGEEALQSVESGQDAEQALTDRERGASLARVQSAVQEALQNLSAEDRLMLKLHLQDGISLLRVAKMVGENDKAIYPRFHRCRQRLRDDLAERGFDRESIANLIGWEGNLMELEWQ
jgi:RNA polymerase sigma factor (sigma-70 family)